MTAAASFPAAPLRGDHPQSLLDVEQPIERRHGRFLGQRPQPVLFLAKQVVGHHPAGDTGEDQQRHQPRQGEERRDAAAHAALDDGPPEWGHGARNQPRARGRSRHAPG